MRFMASDEALSGLPPEVAKRLSFSVGVAAVPDHCEEAGELLDLADKAMYAAKKAGRNQFRMWNKGSKAA
jgi:diguanylate cyclase (GGDEF)-like protein